MKNYVEAVKESARNNTSFRYANSTLEHAKILTEELIKAADKEVCMLSDEFFDNFYMGLSSTIEDFLKKNGTVFKLIVSKNGSKLASDLSDKYPAKFLTKVKEKKDLPTDKDTKETINYLINDKNGFRYEFSDKNADDGIVEAFADFNSPQERDILKNNFDRLFA